jgi:hypothetical protein
VPLDPIEFLYPKWLSGRLELFLWDS